MATDQKTTLPCPACTKLVRAPLNRGSLKLTCPHCRHIWTWQPPDPNHSSGSAFDYYDLLQVASHACPEVINAAYGRLAMKYHPDRNNGDPEAERMMKRLNEAKEVLLNPLKRAEFDRSRVSHGPDKANGAGVPSTEWSLPRDILGHTGNPVPPELDFFVSSPPEIGPLISAHSTLRHGQPPNRTGDRFWSAFGTAFLGWIAGIMVNGVFSVNSDFWGVIWILGLPTAGFIWTWTSTKVRHTCSYIGANGAARFCAENVRENIVFGEVLHFSSATHFVPNILHRKEYGTYAQTAYSMVWYDSNRQPIFCIEGEHRYQDNLPPIDDDYHYAVAAATAWEGFASRSRA